MTTDLIVGFPGETEDDFERTLEVVAEAAYDSAYTFIFSPRPGTRAAAMTERFVPAEVMAERFERLRVVVERSALARHRARVGRDEEVVVEGPSKRDPSVLTGRTGQNKLVHFARPTDRLPAAGSYAKVRVTGAARHHLTGRAGRGDAPAAHRRASRSPPAERRGQPPAGPAVAPCGPGRAHRLGQVGAGPRGGVGPRPAGPDEVELVSVDSMAVYRGMDIGTAKPSPEVRAEVPLPPDRPGRSGRGVHRHPVPGRGPRPPWPGSPAGGTGRCWWAGPGSTCGRWSTISSFPGRYPEVAAELEAELDGPGRPGAGAAGRPGRAPRPAGRARPGGRRPHRAGQPSGGWCGPSR